MKLKIRRYDLKLRHTFTIAYNSTVVQPTLIVELEKDGCKGYGEAMSNGYYGVTADKLAAFLNRHAALIENTPWETPQELWEKLRPALAEIPFAQCAVDEAAFDLWGKLHGKPVYELLGYDASRIPLTNYTIGIDAIDKMVAKMNEFAGWPIYKIKLGTKHDIAIVKALRRHTDAIFRIDANCGWTAAETIKNSAELKELGVEFIEQPLPAENIAAMREVIRESVLPIIADENCVVENDVEKCYGCFTGVNIKLTKCGGMTPALRMISQAKKFGMKVMMGCMVESSVGISAEAQFLPQLDYVDMDGALLLDEDIADGVVIEKGRAVYSPRNGNGVVLR